MSTKRFYEEILDTNRDIPEKPRISCLQPLKEWTRDRPPELIKNDVAVVVTFSIIFRSSPVECRVPRYSQFLQKLPSPTTVKLGTGLAILARESWFLISVQQVTFLNDQAVRDMVHCIVGVL